MFGKAERSPPPRPLRSEFQCCKTFSDPVQLIGKPLRQPLVLCFETRHIRAQLRKLNRIHARVPVPLAVCRDKHLLVEIKHAR